ncbi:cytochrome P450 [Gigaspora rosea]|uniref:Cytochrome P450 n=1 Tax=Gigaspora rosea TaxID=44941 RepID=A0A397TRN9_9GLOM|nr:cytochrome P450 [Gigaspora rosea]
MDILSRMMIGQLPLRNSLDRHKNIFIQRCKPIVEERILQRKELVYATNNSTAKLLTSVFFDYGGRPELWKELYEEQLKIHNESNGNLSIDYVNKMVKLDCYIKESFRHSIDIATMPHMLIADSYTFNNGTTIPRGRDIYLYIKDTNFNNKFYGETSDDFQPKRHMTSYSDGKIVHSPTTKLDDSFMVFGGGKHACPGRFYAVNAIKIFLHESFLRYNIRTESGKIEPPKIISCYSTSSESGLVFENRNL